MILASQNTVEYKEKYIEMMIASAPYFSELFGVTIWSALEHLFVQGKNLFSYQHCSVSIRNDIITGMALCYGYQTKAKENLNTGLLLFRSLRFKMLRNVKLLMQMNKTIGKLSEGDYYISNIAVFQQFRRQGIGKNMLIEIEGIATKDNSKRMVLDVENENKPAISLYKSIGYETTNQFQIKNKKLHINFLRMKKQLK